MRGRRARASLRWDLTRPNRFSGGIGGPLVLYIAPADSTQSTVDAMTDELGIDFGLETSSFRWELQQSAPRTVNCDSQ